MLSPQLGPGEAPAGANLAVKAWNLMGGIDWAALPIVVELLEIEDVETLIRQLVEIRDQQQQRSEQT